jgi:hypothetical protein
MDKDFWQWLRTCLACGKVHEKRIVSFGLHTWTDPVDEHGYRTRVHPETIDKLEAEWLARDRNAEKGEG